MPGGRGRGGKRTGTVGKAYPNRADLNGGKMPVSTAKGQPYGAAKAQADAQGAVPMGTPEVPPTAAFTGRPEGMAAPGSMGDLFGPSENPGEHVMNGASMGPGGGPAALGIDPAGDMRASDLAKMAPYMPALREMARRVDASPALVLYVRRLSAGM